MNMTLEVTALGPELQASVVRYSSAQGRARLRQNAEAALHALIFGGDRFHEPVNWPEGQGSSPDPIAPAESA
ncbi:hypothetical protein OHV05_09115 [Kitasatospora sp. NBC_00070]|uniref:hypothetical protein n=1 Tax=Kitasatospora sp. NBC_00070 TaxID=2975962 RepID=UPI00324F025C